MNCKTKKTVGNQNLNCFKYKNKQFITLFISPKKIKEQYYFPVARYICPGNEPARTVIDSFAMNATNIASALIK